MKRYKFQAVVTMHEKVAASWPSDWALHHAAWYCAAGTANRGTARSSTS